MPPPLIIEKGIYVFKDVGYTTGKGIWTKDMSITQNLSAKSNNFDVSSIIIRTGGNKTLGNDDMTSGWNILSISYNLMSSGMSKQTLVWDSPNWISNAYKTIEITEDCIVDEKFKKWFNYYTTKQ